jgi:hypothetical protein
VYTGFKPAFVLFKRTSSTSNWSLFDNKRNTFNITDSYFQADTTAAEQEYSDIYVDFLSNGFKTKRNKHIFKFFRRFFYLHGFCRKPIRYFNFYTNYGSLIMIALLHIINKNKIKDFKQVKQINTF